MENSPIQQSPERFLYLLIGWECICSAAHFRSKWNNTKPFCYHGHTSQALRKGRCQPLTTHCHCPRSPPWGSICHNDKNRVPVPLLCSTPCVQTGTAKIPQSPPMRPQHNCLLWPPKNYNHVSGVSVEKHIYSRLRYSHETSIMQLFGVDRWVTGLRCQVSRASHIGTKIWEQNPIPRL